MGELLPKRFPAAHGAILGEEERPLPLREGATRGEERRSASARGRECRGRTRRHGGWRTLASPSLEVVGGCRWRSLVLSRGPAAGARVRSLGL